MKVKKYQLILCLWVIIVGSIVFVFFREKFEKNPNALKFENHQFNDSINDTAINYNYYFKIGNKNYYQNTDTMFVYYPKNIKEINTLMVDLRTNRGNGIHIFKFTQKINLHHGNEKNYKNKSCYHSLYGI